MRSKTVDCKRGIFLDARNDTKSSSSMASLYVPFTFSMSSCQVRRMASVVITNFMAISSRCLSLGSTAMDCNSLTEHFAGMMYSFL